MNMETCRRIKSGHGKFFFKGSIKEEEMKNLPRREQIIRSERCGYMNFGISAAHVIFTTY